MMFEKKQTFIALCKAYPHCCLQAKDLFDISRIGLYSFDI